MSNTAQKPKAKGMDRFFDFIERTGNKLPTPFMLFVYLTIATAALSAILSYMGVSVTYMAAGKPVLGSIGGEAAYVIGQAKCGLCAAPENPEAFAETVRKFLS